MSEDNKNDLSPEQKENLIELLLLIVFACFVISKCG